jgi:hypothetical protein
MEFTAFVLLYGDYPALARRCLESLQELPADRVELRLAANAVPDGSETWAAVEDCIQSGVLSRSNVYESSENIHKYPLMRRTFHDPDNVITTPYVMWFDDDSYIREDTFSIDNWLDDLVQVLRTSHMLGAKYKVGLCGNQKEWIEDQPWYNNRPVKSPADFITGGWWCIRTHILHDFDWPIPELDHRGGDVMLGQLLRQHDFKMTQYNNRVAINANKHGHQCSAKKRGYDSKPIGWNYDSGVTKKLSTMLPPLKAARLPYEGLLD